MSDFFEVDPLTGIRSDFKWNENSQEYTINRYQDVEPALDMAKAMANEGGLNREDIKRGWWHYATIPPIVQLQMRAKGINISDPDHQKRMIQEINTEYPFLKTTTGRLDQRPSKRGLYLPPDPPSHNSTDSGVGDAELVGKPTDLFSV